MKHTEGFWKLTPQGLKREIGPVRECLGCKKQFAPCLLMSGPKHDTWLCEPCLFDPKSDWWPKR